MHVALLYLSIDIFSCLNNLFSCFTDTMPRLSELASKKSKARRPSKLAKGEKRKSPSPEDETPVVEPEVPTAPRQKMISLNEPTSQPPALPIPVQGKGKKVLVEPPRPPKKQKRGSEPLSSSLDPAVPQYRGRFWYRQGRGLYQISGGGM